MPRHLNADAVLTSSSKNATQPAKCKHNSFPQHPQISPTPIIFLRTPLLTTPPTPNAGTTLPILATLLPNQSLPTFATLALHNVPSPRGLLYRSNPHRCNGVLNSCIPAGAKNCATPTLPTDFSTCSDSGSNGAMSGGRLNEAKIVRESRSAKRA